MPAATQRHWKAIIRIPLFSMVIKQGKCFLISHPLSLSTITQTLKHFFLKQTKLSRSTFSQLIYMPFRLCFMNPIYHVFFHHKMLGDYAECHPNRVVWISENAQQQGRGKGKNTHTHNLARVENAPCWIFISFNRKSLSTHKAVFVERCWSSQILVAATNPACISALLSDVIVKC